MAYDALHEMGDREVTLHVHTAVSDDAIRLYGFLGRDELRLFRLLIGVERIGPKAALSILGRAELPAMVRAIRDGDVALVATVPGIGRRTAERVILELRDRLADLALSLRAGATHRRRPGDRGGGRGAGRARLPGIGGAPGGPGRPRRSGGGRRRRHRPGGEGAPPPGRGPGDVTRHGTSVAETSRPPGAAISRATP